MTDRERPSPAGSPGGNAPSDAVDNPIERLKLLGGNDEEISAYLDSLEVASPREREMLTEISRSQPLAHPAAFGLAHRNVAEALESLARHGFRGTAAGARLGPLRPIVRWGVQLVARYVVVSHVRHVSTSLRSIYTVREVQALPGSHERAALRRARMDAERMVGALQEREIGLPTFVLGGAAIPIVASIGGATGFLRSETVATTIGVIGTVLAVVVSWFVLRGAAMASRRIRLATRGPLGALWDTIGWCGRPPRDQSRMFATIAIVLTLGSWVLIPVLLGFALAT